MKKAKRCLIAVVSGVLAAAAVLSGCGQSKKEVSKNDDHLTVYLWENRLMKNIAPYIHEQFPDQDIEFIIGNNDTDLYSYFKEHDELPDIITVRRFSGTDAQDLQPYLMDFASYDVVSKYYSYAVQYLRMRMMKSSGCQSVAFRRRSLPTKHCLISMELRFQKIMRNMYRPVSSFMIMA